jgi:ATP-dependent DNA helicase RecQ
MAQALAILQQYWGYPAFRPGQAEIIEAVLAGHDTLALLPTGGGKSVCYQVPGLARPGLCVVVSPLIALIKDQVEQLRRRGVHARAMHSGLSRAEMEATLDSCEFAAQGDYPVKFLYLSPERLATEAFRERAKRFKINLLAIDEAHCISQWGYDFRPPYLLIAAFREQWPGVPCLALTATATAQVRTDIEAKLAFRAGSQRFVQSFARANLSYSVQANDHKPARLLHILQRVPGTSVVYAATRRQAQQTAQWLRGQGLAADFYHAGLPAADRARRQDAWVAGRTRVMVATNAFGMGIDKPDVRTVVHLGPPPSLEAYYQEAGRAGRDGQKAYAVLLYDPEDVDDLRQRTAHGYPAPDLIRETYQRVANYLQVAVGSHQLASTDFALDQWLALVKTARPEVPAPTWLRALQIIEQQGFIQLSEAVFQPARAKMLLLGEELYKYQVANAWADPLIKQLLRLHGGDLFNDFTPINENLLAQRLGLPPDQLPAQLQRLMAAGVLAYAPANDKSQLTWLTPRHAADRLPLDLALYQTLKQRDTEKAEAVVQYLQQANRCRTQLLLEYFGETEAPRCGVCDNCLARQRAQTAPQDPSPSILAKLRLGPLRPEALVAGLPQAQQTVWLATLRQLLATGEVIYNSVGELGLAEGLE